jgi:hypothetical protein
LKKIRKEKTRRDPATRLTFVFFFLLKWCCFDLKKKLIRTTWWPDQNLVSWSKLGTGPWTEPGVKTMAPLSNY